MIETLGIIVGLSAIWVALYAGYTVSVKYFDERM